MTSLGVPPKLEERINISHSQSNKKKIEEKGTFFYSIHETNITLVPKPKKL
jgi:hypothetical protein